MGIGIAFILILFAVCVLGLVWGAIREANVKERENNAEAERWVRIWESIDFPIKED